MHRKMLRIGLELVAWPVVCLALLYCCAATGIVSKAGWADALALGRASAAHMELRALAGVDKLVREKLDPVLHQAAQTAENRLQHTLEPYVAALEPEKKLAPRQKSAQHAANPALPQAPPSLDDTHHVQRWKHRAF